MKPFTFNLEAVLILRQREEQQAARNWAEALRNQNLIEGALRQAEFELRQSQETLSRQRNGRFLPGEHQIHLAAHANQRAICEALAKRLAEAMEYTKKQHAILLEARMKVEVLMRLKEKRKKDYEAAVMAQEEAAIDDMVIARYAAKSREFWR